MNEKNELIIERFECLGSTQEYAKEKRTEGRDMVVSARVQTGGRGTKGRSFESTCGGVYISKLSFYEHLAAKDAFKIMSSAAVAVCETLRFYGLKPVIKWPNDVFVGGKKICGILIENVFSGNRVASSIVGIGLNVQNSLSEELKDIATSMQRETGKDFPVEEVEARLISELCKERSMEEYLAYVGYMGQSAMLILGDERVPATLLFVDNEGGLTVEIEGVRRRLTAAEVSVRI